MIESIAGPAMRDCNHVWFLPSPANHAEVWLHYAKPKFDKEGFLTNTGRFVDRTAAMLIAIAADQLLGPTTKTKLTTPLLRKWKKK